ncbi:MAG: helix-turn-helix transcriptional regulator, partial [Calditrichaceae bacterium]
MKQPELGQFIAGLRKQKGFSQEELSTGCKMNLRSIQRIEAGKVKPRLSTLKALSSVLEYDFLKTKPDLSKPRLSIREKNFLKNYIKSVPDNKLSPTFIWLYSSIIMMAGIIFLTYTYLFTL